MPKTMEKPSGAKIKGTYGTMYYTKDMAKASKFFQQTLGVKPAFDSPEWTEFNFNGHSLCLHPATNEKSCRNGILVIHVDGIRKFVEDLKAKGTPGVTEVHEVHPGSWSAEFQDPDGNTVSLYEGPKGF